MTGAWACHECASKSGHGRGHGYSQGGWCGLGGHATKERIEYYPDARPVTPGEVNRVEGVAVEAPAGTQMALF